MMKRTIMASLVVCAWAAAQPPAVAPPTDAAAPPSQPAAAPKRAPTPPTLDELLGLAPAGQPGDAARDAARDELDRRLAQEEPGDLFQQAIALMETSSTRLSTARDTGLETQRTQEDTLRKLDQLISSLQRRQQQQQQQQQQQNQDNPQDQPQSRPQEADQRDAQQAAEANAADLPGRRSGALRPGLEAAKAAWGALPARIRDMLLQGSGEKFSTTYERQTEEYYRKLAEQK